ncbi:MAG: hypothetical protein IJT91_07360, partial [Clostridia bacterium]|nr:hypothetical protein [Clostridia bacterium]
NYCAPIELLWGDGGEHNMKNCSSILNAPSTSKAYSIDDGAEITYKGDISIAAISSQSFIGEDNDQYYNYVMLVSSKKFADPVYLNGNTYGNRDILFESFRVFGKEQMPVDLDFKVFDDNSIDVTISEAMTWTVFFAGVIPVIILAAGIIVYIRRKTG